MFVYCVFCGCILWVRVLWLGASRVFWGGAGCRVWVLGLMLHAELLLRCGAAWGCCMRVRGLNRTIPTLTPSLDPCACVRSECGGDAAARGGCRVPWHRPFLPHYGACGPRQQGRTRFRVFSCIWFGLTCAFGWIRITQSLA